MAQLYDKLLEGYCTGQLPIVTNELKIVTTIKNVLQKEVLCMLIDRDIFQYRITQSSYITEYYSYY